MPVCQFPGCERLQRHNPTTSPHARWDPLRGEFVPLTEQRTPAQIRRESADAERRAHAERIAAAVVVAEHRRDGESFPRDWDDVQKIATAAALQALTETENAR